MKVLPIPQRFRTGASPLMQFSVIPRTLVGRGSYSSSEVQSAYFTAPANRGSKIFLMFACNCNPARTAHNSKIFIRAFDSIHRGKMEQILLAYGLPKETVAAIMILYRNIKVKVCSPDGDTEYFDIVAGVLQGDTLGPYLFIICLDYVLRTSIDKIRENGFELTKRRSKRYPAKTITDADYADDLALLVNTPNQAETLLHSLERAAAGIGLHVNAHKTEYMCYNQTGNIATLDGASLKLVDKFTYLGSSISSTEKDIDTRLTKAWTAIDRLLITWKSDLTDKIKRSFFQAAVVSILLYGCTTWTLTK